MRSRTEGEIFAAARELQSSEAMRGNICIVYSHCPVSMDGRAALARAADDRPRKIDNYSKHDIMKKTDANHNYIN